MEENLNLGVKSKLRISRSCSLTVVLGLLFTVFCFLVAYDNNFPKNATFAGQLIFLAAKGEGVEEISRHLEEQGIIRCAFSFRLYAFLTGRAGKLQAGRYYLSPAMANAEILEKLASGETAKETITVIEGWGISDIGRILEEKGILQNDFFQIVGFPIGRARMLSGIVDPADCSAGLNFLRAKDLNPEFSFLQDKPPELNLEGYLFPDTYEIDAEIKTETLVRKMLANFDKKLSPELREEIKKQDKTIFQIVVMASMLEKEMRGAADKKLVSGILWKRLEAGMPLQVDATVLYGASKTSGPVSASDLDFCSPYNTYKFIGLPYGPISNPGLESIIAAIEPQPSAYWYYLSAPDGTTFFSETLTEHNIKKIKYLK